MKVWQSSNQKSKVAIVGGVRTPFAKAGTQLKNCSAVHLGVTASREAMARAQIDRASIDEVVFW
jgi:acetyl-CoA acyltransferase